jgi:hypothetical protein
VVASFEAGRHTRAMTRASAMSRSPPGRAKQPGQPERLGLGVDRGDVPMGSCAGHGGNGGGWHERLAGQGTADHLDEVSGQVREVRNGLVLDLPIFAVGPAQQVADVLARVTGLVDAVSRDSGYVHRTRRLRHTQHRYAGTPIAR